MDDQRNEPEVIQRARARIPKGLNITPQTTPVVAFGRPQQARVATLGINPSDREFSRRDGSLLPPDHLIRLHLLFSLRLGNRNPNACFGTQKCVLILI